MMNKVSPGLVPRRHSSFARRSATSKSACFISGNPREWAFNIYIHLGFGNNHGGTSIILHNLLDIAYSFSPRLQPRRYANSGYGPAEGLTGADVGTKTKTLAEAERLRKGAPGNFQA
ncbi:hypothetical protein [Neorhizobium galegae]|uniref:hypothetical protein n=1 Tax=Neorhizobium galegae TaxID=399 RepID=UPI0006279AD9|nr:hypothetical protein [Neorhizobium galegae]KAB1122144.1 hypothetical protein F4V90_23510 [Neorhizobium galegae]MCQ1574952.1 hypothetical protein [Neorhizobium galegae]MCQ1810593.1 hypothetical protein [Neorhizobium galegae]MCQ1837526.1 hypothetical protein [Neorhizobium galegae]UIY31748.1 hypothetical protein LZK73_33120 [Neorhizobium galegae]